MAPDGDQQRVVRSGQRHRGARARGTSGRRPRPGPSCPRWRVPRVAGDSPSSASASARGAERSPKVRQRGRPAPASAVDGMASSVVPAVYQASADGAATQRGADADHAARADPFPHRTDRVAGARASSAPRRPRRPQAAPRRRRSAAGRCGGRPTAPWWPARPARPAGRSRSVEARSASRRRGASRSTRARPTVAAAGASGGPTTARRCRPPATINAATSDHQQRPRRPPRAPQTR